MNKILSFVTWIHLKDITLCEAQDENYCMSSIIFGICVGVHMHVHIYMVVYTYMCREYL